MSNGCRFDKREPLQITSVHFRNALNDYSINTSSLAGTKSGSRFIGYFLCPTLGSVIHGTQLLLSGQFLETQIWVLGVLTVTVSPVF